MNSTINSLNLLVKILWNISNSKKRFQTLFVISFSVLSSVIQYFNILFTAFTFSFITTIAYSRKEFVELDLIFWNKIQLNSDSFINLIIIWIISSIVNYISIMLSSFLIYKLAYSFGKLISKKILNLSINSSSLFYEDISEKTLFNLFTAENTKLIKESILSLITLPMLVTTIIALISIIIKFSINLFFIIPLIVIIYFQISNVIFKSVTIKGKKIFDLRSFQTDILSRLIDNYLDVKFPPSDKAYKKLFNDTTAKLRDLESFLATIPKVLKSFLELILILVIGIYVFYSIYIIKIPIEIFLSSSTAIILSLLKLTPILSGLSSNFLAFNAQHESIKNYYNLIFKSNKYNLFTGVFNYAKVIPEERYELRFEALKSRRITKFSKNSLSLTMGDKKLLWIIGKSGCGKSTFLSLVAGIRPIKEGNIRLLINKNYMKCKSNFIHQNIAYMPQNPIFHSITVLDYIRDGDPNINKSKIKRIIRKLKLSNSFGLSEDKLLRLIIGPRGYNPSGGQAKLLAFGRAIYKKNVYIYLLDEPTSDLSNEFKNIILEAIHEIAKQKFVLTITHDLNAIKKNDQVLSL